MGYVVTINIQMKSVINCVKLIDGIDTYTVAYVPCVLAALEHVQGHLNKFVQVVKL